jgi:N-methylhydantoinase B/oxoprolinase/acetone carboxylase alpha subunit
MTWNEVIMYIIETMLKLIVVVIIPYLFNQIRIKLQNDTQIKYLGMFEQLVKDAVSQVQQTYVENMKAEDLFDEKAQIEAFDMVKSTVLNMMNDRMMKIVMEAVGDFDEYLRNKIEAQVFAIKQNSPIMLGEVISDETGEKASAE